MEKGTKQIEAESEAQLTRRTKTPARLDDRQPVSRAVQPGPTKSNLKNKNQSPCKTAQCPHAIHFSPAALRVPRPAVVPGSAFWSAAGLTVSLSKSTAVVPDRTQSWRR